MEERSVERIEQGGEVGFDEEPLIDSRDSGIGLRDIRAIRDETRRMQDLKFSATLSAATILARQR
jgi:hypothetical protein